MKKLLTFVCALCITATLFGLAACGRSSAKIVGIDAGIGTNQDDWDDYNNPFMDYDTVTENDYVLQVGKEYLLAVTYIATGGSKYPFFNSIDGITLFYDTEVFEITTPPESEQFGQIIYYNLVCKSQVNYASIMVEVDGKYFDTLIISAK